MYTNDFAQAESASQNRSALPSRAEINAADQWTLADLYGSEEEFHAEINTVRRLAKEILSYQGALRDAQSLADCLELRDTLEMKAERLFAYARMSRDTDAANAAYQAMTSQIESLLAEAAGACAFIEPALLALPKQELTALLTEKRLQKYQFNMKNLLRQKEHVLSPVEEKLLAKAGDLFGAPANIYTILTNADLNFPETLNDDGQKVRLSEGRYNGLIRSANREVRKDAFKNLFQTYGDFRNTFAASLNGSIKNTVFLAKVKHYPSALKAALSKSNVPVSVYTKTISTVHDNLSALHEYVHFKQQRLALKQIHMYDLYVPLAKETQQNYPYADGLRLVVESLAPLGKRYCADLTQGVKSGWIDIYENRGKRTGAYSWGVYGVHPFLLLNYDERYGAVSTLAHELGHAMHSYYSNLAQPYNQAAYTIFCAEVASTTNEILLLDYMLEHEQDSRRRAYFLNQYLEQIRTTVYRQTMFAEFEYIIYQQAENGEMPTTETLETLWLTLNRKYYGEQIVLDDEIKIEWARIPHFYRPFYVYQYATGYAAATALAEGLRRDSSSAQTRYLQYLHSGGSDYSIELLKEAGVDMTTAMPLSLTLEKFRRRLHELKNLTF